VIILEEYTGEEGGEDMILIMHPARSWNLD